MAVVSKESLKRKMLKRIKEAEEYSFMSYPYICSICRKKITEADIHNNNFEYVKNKLRRKLGAFKLYRIFKKCRCINMDLDDDELRESKKNENALLIEWKQRLGLQDWVIALEKDCKIEELELKGAGETDWSVTNKTALIKIISEKEYGERITPYDFERILVHELLHCKFSLLDITDLTYESHVTDLVRHQIIDDLARALVMAKRHTVERSCA